MRKFFFVAMLIASCGNRTEVDDRASYRDCHVWRQSRDTMLDLIARGNLEGGAYRSVVLGLERVQKQLKDGECNVK